MTRADAMLARKAWCETRARFAIAVVAIAAACGLAAAQGWGHGLSFAAHVWSGAFNDSAKTVFVMLAILLGGGSLRQEQALGTAGFTLALPVSRARLLGVRAAVAVGETAALAVVVAALVTAISIGAGEPLALGEAVRHVVLWSCCGAALAVAALVVSVFVANEYVSWLVAVLAVMAHQGVVQVTPLRREPLWNVFVVMSGEGVTLAGAGAAAAATVGAVLALAYLRLRRRDF